MQRPRPTFEQVYMDMATSLARRSTCKRLAVGVVITSLDYRKVFAVGYNGNAVDLPNECDRDEPGNCGCLHAEENAAISCTEDREAPKVVFLTLSPCIMCAKRLINLGGVQKVIYLNAYRSEDGLNLLRLAGIRVTMFNNGE